MKSILVHIYDDDGLEDRLQVAFDLARLFDSHLTCLHAVPFEDYLAADPLFAVELPAGFSAKMKRRREALRERVEARLAAEGAHWDWVHVDAAMSTALIRYSAVSDLVIASLGRRALERRDARPLAGAVAVGGRAPVLAVPTGLGRLRLDLPAVLAWNGSAEAAAAMRAALPILKAVPEVHIVEIVEDLSPYPRDLAAHYLSRHGVHPAIVQRENPDRNIGDAIRAAAFDVGAGTIVMGAYSRSRLSEAIFGGVTSQLLAESTLPLILAH